MVHEHLNEDYNEDHGQKLKFCVSPGEIALVAQLDRALASGAKGRWFESTRARLIFSIKNEILNNMIVRLR